MKFLELAELVGDLPLFHSHFLLAGDVDPNDIRRQLSRWTQDGRITMLRRGLYCLAPPWRKVQPHSFVVANHLVEPSYVSCQSALAYYSLIPEYVPRVTSVTTGRPRTYDTPLGSFVFRHIKREWFSGYRETQIGSSRERAFVAVPEKALLDQIHLTPGADDPEYLQALRLQNLDTLSLDSLRDLASRSGKPKLVRASDAVAELQRGASQ